MMKFFLINFWKTKERTKTCSPSFSRMDLGVWLHQSQQSVPSSSWPGCWFAPKTANLLFSTESKKQRDLSCRSNERSWWRRQLHRWELSSNFVTSAGDEVSLEDGRWWKCKIPWWRPASPVPSLRLLHLPNRMRRRKRCSADAIKNEKRYVIQTCMRRMEKSKVTATLQYLKR